MSLYKPPTMPTTREQPFLSLVTAVDPYWAHRKFREVEYEFTGRVVTFNPYFSGAYSRLTNVYPVGAQQGGQDPLIINNLAPTVGNTVPGLYTAVPDGKGWG